MRVEPVVSLSKRPRNDHSLIGGIRLWRGGNIPTTCPQTLSLWSCRGFHRQRVHINTYIWCAVGAGIAWFVGSLLNKDTKIVLVEDIAVGIFGAFIGGDLVAAMFHSPGG